MRTGVVRPLEGLAVALALMGFIYYMFQWGVEAVVHNRKTRTVPDLVGRSISSALDMVSPINLDKLPRKHVSPEDFVRAWQSSSSMQEIAEKIGIKYNAVATRGAAYRKRGIQLKILDSASQTINVDELNNLISEH